MLNKYKLGSVVSANFVMKMWIFWNYSVSVGTYFKMFKLEKKIFHFGIKFPKWHSQSSPLPPKLGWILAGSIDCAI